MADHHDSNDPHDDHDHGGNGKYWAVFGCLCVLTTVSFLTYFEWWGETFSPAASRTMMMAVSCMKATLVMAFFMHLIWEANWKYVLTIPAGMMSVFLVLMLVPDIGCRYEGYTHERMIHAADPGTAEHVHHGNDHGHHDGEEEHGEDHTHADGHDHDSAHDGDQDHGDESHAEGEHD